MKSKQLAAVLIKCIGLYVFVSAIPGCVSGILVGVLPFQPTKTEAAYGIMRIVSYSIGDAVQAAVGIFLIIKSRKLAEFWFKNEDE